MALNRTLLAVLLALGARTLAAAPYRVTLGLFSWQDTLSVSSAATSLPLRNTTFAVAPGAAAEWAIDESLSFDAGANVLFGSTDATLSPGAAAPPISYRVQGATAIGFLARPGLSYRLGDAGSPVTIGASLPILVKRVSYPAPAGGFGVERDSLVAVGFLLETRLTRDSMSLTPRVGFLKSLSRYFWGLELGYAL